MVLLKTIQSKSLTVDGRRLNIAYKEVDNKQKSDSSNVEPAVASADEPIGPCNFTEDEIRKMAEFSADIYAKHPSERANYIEYYRKYYREGGDPTPALKAIYGG